MPATIPGSTGRTAVFWGRRFNFLGEKGTLRGLRLNHHQRNVFISLFYLFCLFLCACRAGQASPAVALGTGLLLLVGAGLNSLRVGEGLDAATSPLPTGLTRSTVHFPLSLHQTGFIYSKASPDGSSSVAQPSLGYSKMLC